LMALSICSTFPMIRTLADRNILRPARGQRLPGAVAGETGGGNQTCEANRRLWPGPSNPAVRLPILPAVAKRRIPDFQQARHVSMTLSGSTADQAPRRRDRQPFHAHDPLRTSRIPQTGH
jgi:hypothetical protein